MNLIEIIEHYQFLMSLGNGRHEANEIMDALIKSLAANFKQGYTEEAIHDACLEMGWSEEDIYLGMIAGKLLYNATTKQEEELANELGTNY
jgi:hypothetical protein